MTVTSSEHLQEAITAHNENFLRRKEINRFFCEDILKLPAQKDTNKEHLKKAKPLLNDIKKLLDAKEKEDGIRERNYYEFPDELLPDRSNLLSPPSALDGYIEEATRQYFVHILDIKQVKPLFDFSENQSFYLRLDDMLKESSLSDSMEIKYTVDWAMIGKALAAKEIEKLTKIRGPRKKRNKDDNAGLIDRKRLDFIQGVESEHIELEMDLGIEDFTILTDYQVVSTYQAMLINLRRMDDNSMDELERHIRLGSMGVEAACNSISRARNDA